VQVLTIARNTLDHAARAPYYLGCLYYDKRQYDLAKQNWELSAQRDAEFPTVWRNLALYYYNKEKHRQLALEYMERAFHLDPTDSRILMELDQLYKVTGRPHAERLAHLEQYPALIAERDDLLLEHITLLNHLGRYDEAMALLDSHIFHPWEGGEGKVPAQYQYARVEKAKSLLAGFSIKNYELGIMTETATIESDAHNSVAQREQSQTCLNYAEQARNLDTQYHNSKLITQNSKLEQAISLLKQCLIYPHHLGEGKLQGAQDNDFHYLLGCAYELLGDDVQARQHWEQATYGPTEPAAAMYYNDAKPEKIFYQGLALLKLGRTAEAHGRFHKLVSYGKQHLFEPQVMDYFAVSLPDLQIWDGDLNEKNRIHCLFMLALGYTGLGDKAHAERYLSEVEQMDINHQGICALRSLC
jgi:tetratricopeptide (TPR) repeat protein